MPSQSAALRRTMPARVLARPEVRSRWLRAHCWTATEVAALLRFSHWHVMRMCRMGAFPHAYHVMNRTRREWRIPWADLEAWQAARVEATRVYLERRRAKRAAKLAAAAAAVASVPAVPDSITKTS